MTIWCERFLFYLGLPAVTRLVEWVVGCRTGRGREAVAAGVLVGLARAAGLRAAGAMLRALWVVWRRGDLTRPAAALAIGAVVGLVTSLFSEMPPNLTIPDEPGGGRHGR